MSPLAGTALGSPLGVPTAWPLPTNPIEALVGLVNPATGGLYLPGFSGVGVTPYLPGGGQGSSPFIGVPQAAGVLAVISQAGPSATAPGAESAGAWASARPSAASLPGIQQAIDMGFLPDPRSLGTPLADTNISTATAQTGRSMTTSIRPQTGEVTGYQARRAAGEIGILAPSGSNVPGPDYVTAGVEPGGGYVIKIADNKIRVTQREFGEIRDYLKPSWRSAVDEAISRLKLDDPATEQAIRDAWSQGNFELVRDTVDFSPVGQGALELSSVPVPVDNATLPPQPTMSTPTVETLANVSETPPDLTTEQIFGELNEELNLASPPESAVTHNWMFGDLSESLGRFMLILGVSVGLVQTAHEVIVAPDDEKFDAVLRGVVGLSFGLAVPFLLIPKQRFEDILNPDLKA